MSPNPEKFVLQATFPNALLRIGGALLQTLSYAQPDPYLRFLSVLAGKQAERRSSLRSKLLSCVAMVG
jgi:hypothetical protein